MYVCIHRIDMQWLYPSPTACSDFSEILHPPLSSMTPAGHVDSRLVIAAQSILAYPCVGSIEERLL